MVGNDLVLLTADLFAIEAETGLPGNQDFGRYKENAVENVNFRRKRSISP